ncbi:hypothetical protein D3C78_1251170 [compost metagenome]
MIDIIIALQTLPRQLLPLLPLRLPLPLQQPQLLPLPLPLPLQQLLLTLRLLHLLEPLRK